MSGRLLVHVGLPKTATTTLQTQYFPCLPPDQVRYLGVRQPRSRGQEDLYLLLLAAVSEGVEDPRLHQGLARLLDQGLHVVVSEEMFTVSTLKGAGWQLKLQRLAGILGRYDHSLLVTVREPAQASFSYFVELQSRFRALGQDYVTAVLSDDAMQIFHYPTLLGCLDAHFSHERVHFIGFDEVVSGDLERLNQWVGMRQEACPAALRPTNQTRIEGAAARKGKRVSASDLLKSTALARYARQVIGTGAMSRLVKATLRPLDAFGYRVERVIPAPTEAEKEQVMRYVEGGWRAMQERMQANG